MAAQAKIILGFGYDDSQLKELRPPTKEELDAVSTEYPVVIVHQSGHIAVFNTKALALATTNFCAPFTNLSLNSLWQGLNKI